MDYGTFLGIITLILMGCFIGLFIWAYGRKRQAQFDEAANLVFADESQTRDKASKSQLAGE